MKALLCLMAAALCLAGGSQVAKIVGEGVISTPGYEDGFAVTPDGKTAFFGKRSPATDNHSMQVICVTHRDSDGHWGAPEIAAFSGEYHDLGPSMSPDGTRLYFISDRPNGDSSMHNFHIWYVTFESEGWSREPRALAAPVNSDAQEYGVSIAANGTLYFGSSRKGGTGSFDIYRSKLENGEYKTVENLGAAVNTEGPEVQPAISPDERILVFTAGGRADERIGVHREYAHGDLYVSFQVNGAWTPARNCGEPINGGGAESWPAFSSDGERFFFTSERGFATKRLRRRMTWAEIERGLKSNLNGLGNIYEIESGVLKALEPR